MRIARHLLLVALVSGGLLLQADAADAGKAKKVAVAAKKKGGIRPAIKKLTFGVDLQLSRGNIPAATAMLLDDSIIARSGSYNKKERKAVKSAQKKVNKAWRNIQLRQIAPGIPAPFFMRAAPEPAQEAAPPAADDKPVNTGQYL